MQINFADIRPADAAILAFPIRKGGAAVVSGLEGAAARLVTAATSAQRFAGEAGSIAETFVALSDGTTRVLLVGVGEGTTNDWEKAGGAVVARLLTSGAAEAVIDLTGSDVSPADAAALGAAAAQRAWRFDEYRTKPPEAQKPTLTAITIVGAPDGTDTAWVDADAVTQGLDLTRTLVTLPPNILYPETFVERVRVSVEGTGLEVSVLDEADMAKLGMGALLGVSLGSAREARVLALRWNGAGEGADVTALVGKGVTFDSGGISIKPGAGMEDMKWDMGGAGAVAGAMKTLALRKAKANVLGVMGLVENMPDGAATRPGDVLTSMSGQTIEVLNTDAEGRLVLADAITWTQATFAPKTIVDLATLTGAMIVSLGHEYGGLFANDEALAGALLEASVACGDKLWRFPLSPTYDKLIDSPIADMKNVGPRGAGSITAAHFIQRYVDDGVKWAHLDIAGMVWSDKAGTNYDKGATGYGVKLLDRFVADTCEG